MDVESGRELAAARGALLRVPLGPEGSASGGEPGAGAAARAPDHRHQPVRPQWNRAAPARLSPGRRVAAPGDPGRLGVRRAEAPAPKKARYQATRGQTTVWVPDEKIGWLSEFTLVMLDIATIDPGSLALPVPKVSVELDAERSAQAPAAAGRRDDTDAASDAASSPGPGGTTPTLPAVECWPSDPPNPGASGRGHRAPREGPEDRRGLGCVPGPGHGEYDPVRAVRGGTSSIPRRSPVRREVGLLEPGEAGSSPGASQPFSTSSVSSVR